MPDEKMMMKMLFQWAVTALLCMERALYGSLADFIELQCIELARNSYWHSEWLALAQDRWHFNMHIQVNHYRVHQALITFNYTVTAHSHSIHTTYRWTTSAEFSSHEANNR